MVCSICLEYLQDPVVTPCGHVFCLECLIACSQKSPDAAKAPCPTCRTTFSLVSPDAAFVPEKYRPFIDSNIRKVYMDNSGEADLQEKVAQLEARVQSLEKDKDLLMDKCESHMAAANNLAQREKDARTRCAALQKELKQANQSFAEVVEKEAQRASASSSTSRSALSSRPSSRSGRAALSTTLSHLPIPSAVSTSTAPSRKIIPLRPMARKRGPNASDESMPPASASGSEGRPAAPLPKRRRVSRHIAVANAHDETRRLLPSLEQMARGLPTRDETNRILDPQAVRRFLRPITREEVNRTLGFLTNNART